MGDKKYVNRRISCTFRQVDPDPGVLVRIGSTPTASTTLALDQLGPPEAGTPIESNFKLK